jgi:hypothetical protein
VTAEVLRVFSHEHNAREVAAQEYQLAKEYLSDVCKHRDPTNPDHQRRFQDAMERQEVAREAYLRAICE